MNLISYLTIWDDASFLAAPVTHASVAGDNTLQRHDCNTFNGKEFDFLSHYLGWRFLSYRPCYLRYSAGDNTKQRHTLQHQHGHKSNKFSFQHYL